MLNLEQIENVTDEERQSDLYYWTKLFKATTWEEITMLAKNNSSISEFVFTLHEMTEDEKIWEQCLARDLYDHDLASATENGIEKGIEQGIQQGMQQFSQLILKLTEANRMDDITRAASDKQYLEQLLKEFNL